MLGFSAWGAAKQADAKGTNKQLAARTKTFRANLFMACFWGGCTGAVACGARSLRSSCPLRYLYHVRSDGILRIGQGVVAECKSRNNRTMVRGIGSDNDVCVLVVFPNNLCVGHRYASAFEIHEVDAIVVGRGVIR